MTHLSGHIKKILFILIAINLYGGGIVHAAQSHALPPELMYNGKAMEPDCLESATDLSGEGGNTANLQECMKKKDKDKNDMSYIKYHYIGKAHGLPIISVDFGGGGSGHFSDMFQVERDGDIVTFQQAIIGGDRCNGGISNASVKNGVMVYDKWMTPWAFLMLAGDVNHKEFKKYNLYDSPPSCYARAHYEDDKLVSVILDPESATWNDFKKPNGLKNGKRSYILVTKNELEAAKKENHGEDYGENTQQGCFDEFYLDYLTRGQTTLSIDELKLFTHKFITQCVKPHSSAH